MENTLDTLMQVILNSPNPIFWKDQNLIYRGCSQSFAKIVGFTHPAFIIGKKDSELPWKHEEIHAYLEEDQIVLQRSSKLHTKMKLFNKKSRKTLSVSKVPLYSRDNKIIGILSYCMEITEQEKLLENLKNQSHPAFGFLKSMGSSSRQFLRGENSEDYILALCHYYESIIACMPGNVYWLNREGVLLGGNDLMAKTLGFSSRTQLVGLNYKQRITRLGWGMKEMEYFKSINETIMHSRVPQTNVLEPPQVINGKTRYWLSNKAPFIDHENKVIGLVGVSLDITDKKEMEMELLKTKQRVTGALDFIKKISQQVIGSEISENKIEDYVGTLCHYYESLIGHMPNYIYWLDKDYVLLGGNENLAKILGLKSRLAITGLTFEQMGALLGLTKEQEYQFKDKISEVIQTGIGKINEVDPPVFINGKIRYYLTTRTPIFDKFGQVTAVLGISADITEQKETEIKLLEEKSVIQQKIKSVSTHVKTPLENILKFTQSWLLTTENEQDEKNKASCSMLIEKIKTLLVATDDILEVSEIL